MNRFENILVTYGSSRVSSGDHKKQTFIILSFKLQIRNLIEEIQPIFDENDEFEQGDKSRSEAFLIELSVF